MNVIERFVVWRNGRRVMKAIDHHTKWCREVVQAIGETNPTLAALTGRAMQEAMIGTPLPEKPDWAELHRRLEAAMDIGADALEREFRRLGMPLPPRPPKEN